MMNWIYTWHNPRTDAKAEELANEMSDIFLQGLMSRGRKRSVKLSKIEVGNSFQDFEIGK